MRPHFAKAASEAHKAGPATEAQRHGADPLFRIPPPRGGPGGSPRGGVLGASVPPWPDFPVSPWQKVRSHSSCSSPTMRLAHLSDTHLGFGEFEGEELATGVNAREMDAYRAFESACRKIGDLAPDAVVHTGDLFDSPRPPNRAIATALREFARLAHARIAVILIAGNHSLPTTRGDLCILEALAAIPGVHPVHDQPRVVHVDRAAFHCIPHSTDEERLGRAVEAAEPDPQSPFNVLLLHAGLRDGAPREWSEARVPRELILRKSSEFDYVALGHYHRSTKIAPMAWYAGSTERFHLEESNAEKGFLLVDLAQREVRHVTVPIRPFSEGSPIDCTGLPAEKIRELVRESARCVPSGSVWRIRLDGVTLDQEKTLDLRALRRDLPRILHLEIDLRRARSRAPRRAEWLPAPLPTQFERFLGERVSEADRTALMELTRRYFKLTQEVPDG